MRSYLLVLLAFAGCDGGTTPIVVDDTDEADTDTDTDTDTDADTDTDVGTDDDHDGWTVEEGDCDDSSVWVNPAWDERPNDDLDNDCDGRVDEKFAGVLALQVHDQGAETSTVHTVGLLGDVKASWSVGSIYATWMDERLDRQGWLALDPNFGTLWSISKTGVPTLLWSIEDDPSYDPDTWPSSLWGVASAPDGSALVSGGGELLKITWDDATVATTPGTAAIVGTWAALEEDGTHQIWASCLTAHPITGEVSLFGYFGGFATFTEAGGLVLHAVDDPDAPSGNFADAHSDDKGVAYALGSRLDSTGTEVTTGIWRYNPTQQDFVRKGHWINSDLTTPIDFAPVAFGVDSESGEFYVTANGGWYRTIWRVFPGTDSYATQLYTNVLGNPPDPVDAHRKLWAAAILWSED